ncbi:MAG: hypothetical protein ACR2G4_12185 [Pyrinomonadaceae bacterium]
MKAMEATFRNSMLVVLALMVVGLFALSCQASGSGNFKPVAGAPGEDEIKETIKKGFDETYLSSTARDIYGVASVEYEFGPIKVGSIVKKQMGRGEEARDVYPVRVKVTVKQTRKDGEVRTVERGIEGETFFFFKDGFDEWSYRTGKS